MCGTYSDSPVIGAGRGVYSYTSGRETKIYIDEKEIKKERRLDDREVARRYLNQYNSFYKLLAEIGLGDNLDRYKRAKKTLESPSWIITSG